MRHWYDDLIPLPLVAPDPVIYATGSPELGGVVTEARAAERYHAQHRTPAYRLLHGLKQRRDVSPALAGFLASELAGMLGILVMTWRDFDVVTWAPSTARRAYNIPELIARRAARAAGIPAGPLLVKSQATPSQRSVARFAERRLNVAGTISLIQSAPDVAGRVVLLIDDVLTTGATITACARPLARAGATVYAAALFSTRRK